MEVACGRFCYKCCKTRAALAHVLVKGAGARRARRGGEHVIAGPQRARCLSGDRDAMAECPFAKPQDINFMDPVVQENWFDAYRVLHRDAPVYHMAYRNMYIVTN